MIIICQDSQADYKKFKKLQKIVVSYDYGNIEGKNIIQLKQLLPEPSLINKYCNGDMTTDKFRKKYIRNIQENDEIYATLVLLMMGIQKTKDLVFVCSEYESELEYLNYLCEMLYEKFGVEYLSFKKWKKKGCHLGDVSIDKKALKKAVNKYKDIINDDYEPPKKKKKKDKVKKVKTIDDLYKVTKKNKKLKKKKKKKYNLEEEAKGFGVNYHTSKDKEDEEIYDDNGFNTKIIDPDERIKHIVHIKIKKKGKRKK